MSCFNQKQRPGMLPQNRALTAAVVVIQNKPEGGDFLGYGYIFIGVLLILWGGSQVRRSLKPFRLRPFLLIVLGLVMIYNGIRLEF
jgi:hypothetical protein